MGDYDPIDSIDSLAESGLEQLQPTWAYTDEGPSDGHDKDGGGEGDEGDQGLRGSLTGELLDRRLTLAASRSGASHVSIAAQRIESRDLEHTVSGVVSLAAVSRVMLVTSVNFAFDFDFPDTLRVR